MKGSPYRRGDGRTGGLSPCQGHAGGVEGPVWDSNRATQAGPFNSHAEPAAQVVGMVGTRVQLSPPPLEDTHSLFQMLGACRATAGRSAHCCSRLANAARQPLPRSYFCLLSPLCSQSDEKHPRVYLCLFLGPIPWKPFLSGAPSFSKLIDLFISFLA